MDAYRSGTPKAPPADNKENHSRPPPRPLDVPQHIKAEMHREVIRETAPSAAATSSDVFRASSAPGTGSAAPSWASLMGKPVKKASFSDVVDGVEIEAASDADDTAKQDQGTRRVKGSKLVVGKVTTVKAAPKQDIEECKVQ